MIEKAFACVVRGDSVLVFDHPEAGTQFVKGSIEAGESVEEAVFRELNEESGMTDVRLVRELGVWEGEGQLKVGVIPETEWQRWHVWLVEPVGVVEERWSYPADEGHVYTFHWVRIDECLADLVHPVQRPVVEMLLSAGERI